MNEEPKSQSNQIPDQGFEGPSVLDWVKSVLRRDPIPIPRLESIEPPFEPINGHDLVAEPRSPALLDDAAPVFPLEEYAPEAEKDEAWDGRHFRHALALFFSVLLALIAQFGLEGRPESPILPATLYFIALALIGWVAWSEHTDLEMPSAETGVETSGGGVRIAYLGYGVVLSGLTFLFTRENRFTVLNLLFWVMALGSILLAFWEGPSPWRILWPKVRAFLRTPRIQLDLDPWKLLVLLVIALIIWVRFAQLDSMPNDMWSDHAEKLFDVKDVLEGRYAIFFTRNTGREMLQFYLTAAIARFFGTGLSFLSLKIGTALIGLMTLPFIYLFAKEIAGKEVGLAAMFLAGIAYWPNVISRMGLRFPLYPLFAAPALYYLLRGLRTKSRNDFLAVGFAVGLGLHGYSPARVLPVVVAAGVGIYILHARSKAGRLWALSWLALAGVVALVVFLPLMGAVANMPDYFLSRMMTRMGTLEQPYPGNPVVIFFKNLWDASIMFAWDNGGPWVSAILNRPALDWATGALFHLGLVVVLIRYARQRAWQDLFLLVSIPLLLLPSILALAFPIENPALNRSSGAIVPVFTVAAFGLISMGRWIQRRAIYFTYLSPLLLAITLILFYTEAIALFSFLLLCAIFLLAIYFLDSLRVLWRRYLSSSLILIFAVVAFTNNWQLVFETFAAQIRASLWNTRQVGAVVEGFATSVVSYDNVHVVAYPHWIDTRLVAIEAGEPGEEYGVWPEDLDRYAMEERMQLYILNPKDEQAKQKLESLFPYGRFELRQSDVPGHEFMLYIVPHAQAFEDRTGNGE